MRPLLTRLAVAAEPSAWREAGFQVDGQNATAGAVTISLGGAGSGKRITGWELAGLGSTELDGLPTGRASDAPAAAPAAAHPNGVTRLDHVVAFSPDLDRTVSALEAAGLDLRRVREGPTAAGARRQAFFRVGDPLLEVIEHPPGTEAAQHLDAPARFWGLAFVVRDLEESAARLGQLLGDPRDAIQPGRRIATVRREAALGVPVALMSSED